MAECENPGQAPGALNETAASNGTVSDGENTTGPVVVDADDTATSAVVAARELRRLQAVDEIAAALNSGDPDLSPAGLPYALPIEALAAVVTDAYLRPSRLPRLRAQASVDPLGVGTDLLGRINDRIALQNARIKNGELTGSKRETLIRLGFTELARLVMAMETVVVLRDTNAGGEDSEQPAFYNRESGLYVTSEKRLREVVRRYAPVSQRGFPDVQAAMEDFAPRRTRNTDRDLIAVENGVYHYGTGELLPFSSDLVFTSKVMTRWNPEAQNPVIPHPDGCVAGHADPADCSDRCLTWDAEGWMRSLMMPDPYAEDDGTETYAESLRMTELLWQTFGAPVRPQVSWNKAAFLTSEVGNNGKGTLVEAMRNVIGPEGCVNLPLARAGQRFGMAELLRGPQAILTDENPVGTFVDDCAGLKAVITGDAVAIERKNRDWVTTKLSLFMVQCMNESPKVRDRSPSFLRRLLIVPFAQCFTGVEREYIKNDFLARPEVREYMLRRALDHALTPAYYKLSEPDTVKRALAEFREDNDPIHSFWQEVGHTFTWDLVPFPFIYEVYKAWLAKNMPNSKPLGRNRFIVEIVALVHADPHSLWECRDRTRPHRPGARMVMAEPLIGQYNLAEWGDPSVNVKDRDSARRRCTHPQDTLARDYRGLLRRDDDHFAANGAAASAATPAAVVVDKPLFTQEWGTDETGDAVADETEASTQAPADPVPAPVQAAVSAPLPTKPVPAPSRSMLPPTPGGLVMPGALPPTPNEPYTMSGPASTEGGAA